MHLTEEPFFTHPNLPQGKEQVTPNIGFSPHLSSPRRGGTDTIGRLVV